MVDANQCSSQSLLFWCNFMMLPVSLLRFWLFSGFSPCFHTIATSTDAVMSGGSGGYRWCQLSREVAWHIFVQIKWHIDEKGRWRQLWGQTILRWRRKVVDNKSILGFGYWSRATGPSLLFGCSGGGAPSL